MKKICILVHKLGKDFFYKWKNFGFLLAFYNFVWWVCFYTRPPFALKLSTWAIKKKTKWFDKYFEGNYSSIINYYKNNIDSSESLISNYRIWIFWGQGEENMPLLVKACYRQLAHLNKDVILITNSNIQNYIELNPIIYKKVESKIISWANYSDIIRMMLLAKYGGLWIDSTVWVSKSIPLTKILKYSIFTPNGSVKKNKRDIRFWTSFEWNWSTWCFGTNRINTQLISFVGSMLKAIGERENCWPDYVIQDYLIYYACRNFNKSCFYMNQIQNVTGQRRNDLATLMNECFDIEKYRELTKDDYLFKLSFRSEWRKVTLKGEQTFYGKIINIQK